MPALAAQMHRDVVRTREEIPMEALA
jgi:hypothetical protein